MSFACIKSYKHLQVKCSQMLTAIVTGRNSSYQESRLKRQKSVKVLTLRIDTLQKKKSQTSLPSLSVFFLTWCFSYWAWLLQFPSQFYVGKNTLLFVRPGRIFRACSFKFIIKQFKHNIFFQTNSVASSCMHQITCLRLH